jgi:hypothetical protein
MGRVIFRAFQKRRAGIKRLVRFLLLLGIGRKNVSG